MKLIKKLNPFNPILPALCLLIAFAWVGYDSFFREKYTEEEKIFFEDATGGIKSLGYGYFTDTEKMLRKDWDFRYEYCLEKDYTTIYVEGKKLDDFMKQLVYEKFYSVNFSEDKEISIHSAFNLYIEKAKELDPILVEKYKDFKLENGLSDEEINQIYFSHDSIQSAYHLARFEMQLSKMYHDDIELLINQKIKNVILEKIKNSYTVPYIVDKTGEIFIHTTYPFDTVYTKIILPKGIETKFNEKGHLIIPSSLRNRANARNFK